MARQLSKQGVFNVGNRSLGYIEARTAVRVAAKSHPSGAETQGQAFGSHKDGVWKLGTLRSTVSEADLPTPTSETAMKSFDQLLKDHLETSRAASAVSAVSTSLEPSEALESIGSPEHIGELDRVTRGPQVVRNLPIPRNLPLLDAYGHYLDTHLEKIYSVLKPHLKGMRVDHSKSTTKINHDIRGLCGNDLSRLVRDHHSRQLMRLARQLAIRGLFLVDYEKFPTYRVAAQEACRMFPEHFKSALIPVAAASDNASLKSVETFLSQHDQNTGHAHPESENATEGSKELPSPHPWETVRLPNMNELEPTTNRDMVPDFWRMRFFPALETSTQLNNLETSDALEAGCIRLPCSPEPASTLKQPRELQFIGLQLSQSDHLETPDQVHEQKQIPEFAPSKRLELPTDSRFGKPSRILRVYGHTGAAAKIYIPKAFANFSPTKFTYKSRKKLAFVHFTGIEAATEALRAKNRALIGSRFLKCEFSKEILQESQATRKKHQRFSPRVISRRRHHQLIL